MTDLSKLLLLYQMYNDKGVSPRKFGYFIDQYLFPYNIRGLQLLDVGGADGSVALWLMLKCGANVDVLDEYAGHGSAMTNKNILYERLRQLRLQQVKVITSDFRTASIPEHSYDVIYTINCLHHIYERGRSRDNDVVEGMRVLHQWLKPRGKLIISDVGWMHFWRLIPPLRRRILAPGLELHSKSSFRRWRRCTMNAGFAFCDVRWYVPYPLRHLKFIFNNEISNPFLKGIYVLEMIKL